MRKQEFPNSAKNIDEKDSRDPIKKKKILIADDDPGIQEIFSIIFENAGFAFEIKENGEDLLKNKFTVPDVFLVDKQLSGYRWTGHLQAS